MKKLFGLLFVSVTIFSSCYYDVDQQLYPSTACDTTNITYSATIVPILQNNTCIGCHSTAGPSGNIILDTYSGVKSAVLSGKLYGSVTHGTGFSAMPPSGSKLSDCDIKKLTIWINSGTLNN